MPYRTENHLEVLASVYRPAPSDRPTSRPFRQAGVFRRLDLSKLTGSWTRHRSPFARKLGPVPHFHGRRSHANAVDTTDGIELTKAGVPSYILRGQTEYTILSFYRVINRPTDTQATRGSTTPVQTLDPN
jgi:hypothetical protein